MSSINNIGTDELLKQIRSKDVEDLINDLELLESGYVINYIIDPYDIFRFCFPYGIKYDERNRSLDNIGDEMIGYSYFFRNNVPIILDEYKLELIVNRNNAHKALSEHINKNLFDELEKQLTTADEKEKEEIYKELHYSATFLLSSAYLTKTFIERFDAIFKRLQIDSYALEQGSKIDEEIIYRTFRNNKRSDWSAEAFKDWVREKDVGNYFKARDKKGNFIIDAEGNFISRPAAEITNELKTTFTDYVVIDRICNINDYLQGDNNLKGKYLFLYFSSANKSEDIFSKNKTREHLPTIKSEEKIYSKFNILRRVKHAYFLSGFSGKSRKEVIIELRRMREIAKAHEESEELLKQTSGPAKVLLEKEFENIKNRLRREFEETTIKGQINEHKEYQTSLRDTITKIEQEIHNLPKLKKLYENLLEKAKSVSLTINPIISMEADYYVQFSLSKLLEFLVEKRDLDLHKGLDLIEGNYQHLPILLFINNQNLIDKKLKSLLFEVIDFVVKSPKIRKKNLKDFFEKIKKLYTESEKVYLDSDKTERENLYYPNILIKSLIYLILPFKSDKERQEDAALMFVNDSFETLKVAEKYREEKYRDLHKLFERRERSYKTWQYDYRYFLIWATRRNDKIEISLRLAEEAIKLNSDDPRFHHGKCLALHNKYTKDNLNINEPDCLDSLIESAEKAIKLYKENRKSNQNYDKFIDGSIIALQNTILYAVLLSYWSTFEGKSENLITDNPKFKKYSLDYLRNDLLIPIENYEKSNNQNYQDFPELAHSEAVLELCEAINFLKLKDIDNAISKASRAAETIERSINIDTDSILYKKTKEKIKNWEILILKSSLTI